MKHWFKHMWHSAGFRKTLDWIAVVFVLISALNWSFTIFGFNLVTFLFNYGFVTGAVYILIGLSALWIIARTIAKRFMK